jgi:N-acetylneuraminate synthase
MAELKIGSTLVGDGHPCYVIGEIGINHNGDVEIAKKLIEMAEAVGCNAVKFQKRTVEIVYTAEELAKLRENPFGTTNGDLKRGLEFSRAQYEEIDRYCKEAEIAWFSSCWDEGSVDFIEHFHPPCYKIASASLTDDNLLRYTRKMSGKRPLLLSTGMSTLEQIDHAVDVLGKENLIIVHATSTYPSVVTELNIKAIPMLRQRYGVLVGYSGHESGVVSTAAAVVLGACVVERHITLDRAMWGSDQAASLGPAGISKLIQHIRNSVEPAMGDGVKRVYPSELPIQKKLRRK